MKKWIFKTLKKPFFGNFMVKWRNPMDETQQREWQEIQTQSPSGGLLQGLWAESRTTSAKATIVLGHPMGKEAKGYFIKNGYTDLLLENGFNVLIFDINGFGESSHGNFSYFDDIMAISIKAKEICPHLPIGYHGISLGGMWATIAFADPKHCYDFAIVESAATSLEEFWVHFPTAYRVLKMMGILMPAQKKRVTMIERIKEAKRLKSILFIYSDSDHWTPSSMGERFVKNSGVPATLWTVSDAQHAAIMKSSFQESYKKKIIEYFNSSVESGRH